MAIGVVSEEDFITEVNKTAPITSPHLVNGQVIDSPIKGRGENNLEVPDSLRKVIGEVGAVDGRQEALALGKMFGISPSAASAYSNGATSTASYNEPSQGIQSVINKRKERISQKASKVLNKTLNVLTEDGKLSDVKPIELSAIARNMASIVKDMEPERERESPDGNKGVTFVLYAPQFSKEDKFEVIELNE